MRKTFINISSVVLIVLIIILGSINRKAFAAENDNYIYDLSIDGYWKPGDVKKHDFEIRNGIGEKCYLESLSFKQISIKDLENDKEYSLLEAEKADIIDAYDITLYINDDKYGESILYSGKLKNISDNDISMEKDLFMDIDQSIKFQILISFDEKAQNQYQNKNYQFILTPKSHKVIYSEDGSDKYTPNTTQKGYYDEDGRFHKAHKDEDGNWVEEGFFDNNGEWVDIGYNDEDGNWHEYGHDDQDGNYVIDGYYDEDGNWHNGYYYDRYGVKHEMEKFSDTANRINKYFKTGQGMIIIIGYEVMFITCSFFVLYRIRQRQNVL